MILLLIPAILSLLVLAAHWLRVGFLPGVIASLLLAALLFVRRRWALVTVRAALALSVVEWVRTTLLFVNERRALGGPWLRLALILGTVAALALLAAWLLGRPRLRGRYPA